MFVKCAVVGESVVGDVRSSIARSLHGKGLTQSEISRMLNITQPMVSHYLRQESRKASKEMDGVSYLQELSEDIYSKGRAFFSFIVSTEPIKNDGTYFLCAKEHIFSENRLALIKELSESLAYLKDKDVSFLISDVKVNLACARSETTRKEDVLAIPGGLVFSDNKLLMHAEPLFGCSNHLAGLLLDVMRVRPDVTSIMNVTFNVNVYSRLKDRGYTICYFKENYSLPNIKKRFDVLVHKGGFGIEPTLYIVGRDSRDVVEKVVGLL